MPAAPTPPLYREYQPPGLFRKRPIGSWVAIGALVLALVLCWSLFWGLIAPIYLGWYDPPRVEADSSTYYEIAGVLTGGATSDNSSLISFGGNLLGPVVVAKVLRDPFFVAIFNSLLILLLIHLAGQVPGVRRRYFILLFFLNAESYVAIITLNKEIFAAIGVVAFIAAVTRPEKRTRYLALASLFSMMARWEQLAIMLIYLGLEGRLSPFRRRPKTALLFLLASFTVIYPFLISHFQVDVGSYLVMAGNSGTIARLDDIQAKFGLPLVILPKILMNLFNRWVVPTYFISDAYLSSSFHELQNGLIIHLHCLVMLVLFVVAAFKRRLGFDRPIPYLIYLYLLVTCVNPFVQPRYQYPVYVLLCLQLAILPEIYAKSAPQTRAPVQVALAPQ